MKKAAILLLFVCSQAIAQSSKMSIKKTFELEVDPIAYALKGYSIHGIYNHNHFRYDLGFYGIEQPAGIVGNKGFTTMTTGFGLKVNYLLKGVKGVYVGLDAGYGANEVTQKESGLKDVGHNFSVGAHAGYRFFPFSKKNNALSGLYITPWAGISINDVYDKVQFSGYKEDKIGYFATFHIGYRF